MLAYFGGLALLQLPGGHMARRWGGKPVMCCSLLGYTAAMIALPYAAQAQATPGVLGSLFIVGFSEGGLPAATDRVLCRWLPIHERRHATYACSVGSIGGSMAAALLFPQLADSTWVMVCYSYGASCAVLLFCCCIWGSSTAFSSTSISPAERAYIARFVALDGTLKRGPGLCAELGEAAEVACSCAGIGTLQAHMAHNYVLFMLLMWLPAYLHQQLHLAWQEVGLYIAVMWLLLSVSQLVSCAVADALITKRHCAPSLVRRGFQCTSALGAAGFLVLFGHSGSPSLGFLCLAALYSSLGMAQAGYAMQYRDLGADRMQVLLGLGNALSTLPGLLSPVVVWTTLDAGSSLSQLFTSAALVLGSSAVVFAISAAVPTPIVPSDQADDDSDLK